MNAKTLRLFFLYLFSNSFCLFPQIVIHNSEEAASIALKNARQLQLNSQNAVTSYKSASHAIQPFLPTFDFTWTEDDSIKKGGGDSRNKTIQCSVRQTVFDGGRRKLSYDMNKAARFFDVKSTEQNINTFKAQVMGQYFTCVYQQKLIGIKSDLVENANIQLEILKKEYELGMALENDYLEYLIAFRKLQDEQKQSERNFSTQLRKLKIMLGFEMTTPLAIEDTDTITSDSFCNIQLEQQMERFWSVLQAKSAVVQQARTSLYYSEKQFMLSRKTLIPEISVEGGLSFSGTEYPLGNTNTTAKISVSFSENPLFPLSLTNGYGFDRTDLKSVNNTAAVSLTPQPNYFYTKKAERINLNLKKQEYRDNRNELYETLFQKIAEHDDSLVSIQRSSETIELAERRLVVSEEQVLRGEMKKIDYLNALVDLAEEKANLEMAYNMLKNSERELEIMLCISFGGLCEFVKED